MQNSSKKVEMHLNRAMMMMPNYRYDAPSEPISERYKGYNFFSKSTQHTYTKSDEYGHKQIHYNQ